MVDIAPFLWSGNRPTSAADAARQRSVAQALMAQNSNVASNPWEGIAQVARAYTGSVLDGRASDAEGAGQEEVAALLAGLGTDSDLQSIMSVMGNEWASPAQQTIAQMLFGEQMRQAGVADERGYAAQLLADERDYNNPLRQAQLEAAGLANETAAFELEQLLNPAVDPFANTQVINDQLVTMGGEGPQVLGDFRTAEPGFRPLTPEEADRYGIAPGTPAQINDVTGEVKGLGGVNVTTNVGGSPSNFFQSLGEAEVENYTMMLQQGPVAARTLNQIDQLESLLANTPQGFGAAATAFAGNFGIDLGDASGVQAATALINQMVPAQRPPGSGPMSDADLELFKQSVPRLINQPGGNELIIQTMRDMAQYDLALSRIIQEHTWLAESARSPEEQSEIRRQMRDQIDALQNPLENFNARIAPYRREGDTPEGGGQSQANPDVFNPAAQQTQQRTTSNGVTWSIN